MSICEACQKEFEPPARNKARRSCSRSCAVTLSWRDPKNAAQRRANIGKAHSTPEALARLAIHNARRWSDPVQHEKLSEQNRRRWRDPAVRENYGRKIRKFYSNPEARAKAAEHRRKFWRDPENRRRIMAAMVAGQADPNYRANSSRALKARWADPLARLKLIAGIRRNARKASIKSKLSFSAKNLWADPEFREKMRLAMLNSPKMAGRGQRIWKTRRQRLEKAAIFNKDLAVLRPRLKGFAWKLARSSEAAEDLISITLLKALEARSQFKPGSNLFAWACMIMKNTWISEGRRSWRKVDWSEEKAAIIPDGKHDRAEQAEELANVMAAMRGLPEDQRKALLLIAAGMSYDEAAQKLGVAEGTIKSRVARARSALVSRDIDKSLGPRHSAAADELIAEIQQVLR